MQIVYIARSLTRGYSSDIISNKIKYFVGRYSTIEFSFGFFNETIRIYYINIEQFVVPISNFGRISLVLDH